MVRTYCGHLQKKKKKKVSLRENLVCEREKLFFIIILTFLWSFSLGTLYHVAIRVLPALASTTIYITIIAQKFLVLQKVDTGLFAENRPLARPTLGACFYSPSLG